MEIKRVLNDDTRCHDEACTWHHSALSSLAGVVSHSTDQPGGKIHGQVKLAIWSSNVSHGNKVEPQARMSILILSKTYPTMGILSPLPRHASFLAGWVCFAEKATKSKSLISDFRFKILVQLTLLSEHLSNSIHSGKQLFFIIQSYSSSSLFHVLLYVAKGLSSLNNREKRTIWIDFARQT